MRRLCYLYARPEEIVKKNDLFKGQQKRLLFERLNFRLSSLMINKNLHKTSASLSEVRQGERLYCLVFAGSSAMQNHYQAM